MSDFASAFALPLLAKDLRARAERPGTYFQRVLYAALFFAAFLWMTRAHLAQFVTDQIGTGDQLIEPFMILQLIGIHLFTPALMCGAIAGERERGSLPLLLLTPISPAKLVVQKFLAGLIPMFTILLLGAPLLGIGYAFGGLNAADLIALALILPLALLEVGAFTLLCSAFFPPPVARSLRLISPGPLFVSVAQYLAQRLWGILRGVACLFIAETVGIFLPISSYFEGGRYSPRSFIELAVWSLPSLMLTLILLLLARWRSLRCPPPERGEFARLV